MSCFGLLIIGIDGLGHSETAWAAAIEIVVAWQDARQPARFGLSRLDRLLVIVSGDEVRGAAKADTLFSLGVPTHSIDNVADGVDRTRCVAVTGGNCVDRGRG